MKLNTGSRPEETLSANSEMVPVGAIEVTSALRMPCAAIASLHVRLQVAHGLAGEELIAVEEREGALLRGDLGRGEIGGAVGSRAIHCVGQLDRARAAIARAAQDQRVGKPGDAEPDAPLGVRLLRPAASAGSRETSTTLSIMRTATRHEASQLIEVELRIRR